MFLLLCWVDSGRREHSTILGRERRKLSHLSVLGLTQNMGMPQNEGILSKIPCSFYSSCSAKQETLLSLWTIYPNFSSSMSRSRISWIKLIIFSSNLKYALVHYLSDFESSTSGSILTQRCRGSLSLANMVECPFCVRKNRPLVNLYRELPSTVL